MPAVLAVFHRDQQTFEVAPQLRQGLPVTSQLIQAPRDLVQVDADLAQLPRHILRDYLLR